MGTHGIPTGRARLCGLFGRVFAFWEAFCSAKFGCISGDLALGAGAARRHVPLTNTKRLSEPNRKQIRGFWRDRSIEQLLLYLSMADLQEKTLSVQRTTVEKSDLPGVTAVPRSPAARPGRQTDFSRKTEGLHAKSVSANR